MSISTKELTNEEKSAIDDVLTNAENELKQNKGKYKIIYDIDEQCRNLWPSWNPPSVVSYPVTKSKDDVQNETTQNKADNEKEQKTNTLSTGSQNFENPEKTEQEINLTSSLERLSDKMNNLESEPEILSKEIDELKDEVQDLMQKIQSTVKTSHLPPEAARILARIKEANEAKRARDLQQVKEQLIANDQSQQQQEQQNTETIIENESNEITEESKIEPSLLENLEKNESKDQEENKDENGDSANPPQPIPSATVNVEQFQIVHRVRTKKQIKSAIASVKREMKEIEQENLSLKKQFRELRQQYLNSQKELQNLKLTLSRSEAIRQRMMNSFGQHPVSIIDQAKLL